MRDSGRFIPPPPGSTQQRSFKWTLAQRLKATWGIVLAGGQGLHAVQVAGEAHAVGSKPLVKADVGRAQAGTAPTIAAKVS